MSRWTVFDETESCFARELVLGWRPSLISWWMVCRRRHSGRSLNAPSRPTLRLWFAAVAGATAVTKCPRCAGRHDLLCPPRDPVARLSHDGPAGCRGDLAWPGRCYFKVTMQIPYDLEFVENRPLVGTGARAVALPKQ